MVVESEASGSGCSTSTWGTGSDEPLPCSAKRCGRCSSKTDVYRVDTVTQRLTQMCAHEIEALSDRLAMMHHRLDHLERSFQENSVDARLQQIVGSVVQECSASWGEHAAELEKRLMDSQRGCQEALEQRLMESQHRSQQDVVQSEQLVALRYEINARLEDVAHKLQSKQHQATMDLCDEVNMKIHDLGNTFSAKVHAGRMQAVASMRNEVETKIHDIAGALSSEHDRRREVLTSLVSQVEQQSGVCKKQDRLVQEIDRTLQEQADRHDRAASVIEAKRASLQEQIRRLKVATAPMTQTPSTASSASLMTERLALRPSVTGCWGTAVPGRSVLGDGGGGSASASGTPSVVPTKPFVGSPRPGPSGASCSVPPLVPGQAESRVSAGGCSGSVAPTLPLPTRQVGPGAFLCSSAGLPPQAATSNNSSLSVASSPMSAASPRSSPALGACPLAPRQHQHAAKMLGSSVRRSWAQPARTHHG